MNPLALAYAVAGMQLAAMQTVAAMTAYAWTPHPPAELVELDKYRSR